MLWALALNIRHCCGLFIESIQYSIRAYNFFSWMNEAKNETHKHWTFFYLIFHELNILFTLQCFIAHMLDTTFVTFIIGVFFAFILLFLHFVLTFQSLTITKHEWTNQSDYQWFFCCIIFVLNSAMEFGFFLFSSFYKDRIRDRIVAMFEVDD